MTKHNRPEHREDNDDDNSISKSLQYLQLLTEKQREGSSVCQKRNKQIEFTRGLVINTVLRNYGGFGKNEAIAS